MLDIITVVLGLGILIYIAYLMRNEETVYESEQEEDN